MPRTHRDILAFRCDPDTHAEVKARAIRHGVTIAEEVRTLLEWALEDHPLDRDDPLTLRRVSAGLYNHGG